MRELLPGPCKFLVRTWMHHLLLYTICNENPSPPRRSIRGRLISSNVDFWTIRFLVFHRPKKHPSSVVLIDSDRMRCSDVEYFPHQDLGYLWKHRHQRPLRFTDQQIRECPYYVSSTLIDDLFLTTCYQCHQHSFDGEVAWSLEMTIHRMFVVIVYFFVQSAMHLHWRCWFCFVLSLLSVIAR